MAVQGRRVGKAVVKPVVLSDSASRRLDEKERRRDEILDAAERILLRKGFDAAKMEDIARAARVSRALLYLYFRDRTELQFGLGLRALEKLRECFAQARTPHPRGIDQLSAVGHAYTRFAREHPVYFIAISRMEGHHAALDDATSIQHRLMNAGRLVHAETVAAILLGQRDGTLRKDLGNPVQVAMTLWGFMHGVAQLAMTKREVFAKQGLHVEQFIDGSVAMATRALAA